MSLSPFDSEHFPEIREGVRRLCAGFPGEYWRDLDTKREYPTAFVNALTEAGYLAVLIPEEYGGSGLGLSAAAAVLETIQSEGCNGGACHAQMYIMGTILRHGSAEQKLAYLPRIATGELRLRLSASRSRRAGPTRRRSARPRCGMVTIMSSTDRRSGRAVPSIAT